MAGQSIANWLKTLPIPWLLGRANGQADADAWGGYSDYQVGLLKEAVKARFPSYGPVDALPHIAGDRKLILGPYTSDDDNRQRLLDSWSTWSRAGQPVALLEQLYYGGFSGAVLVTQNGLGYSLSAAPTPGEDPTDLLVITELNALIAPENLAPYPQRESYQDGPPGGRLVSSKTISEDTPWWRFDFDTTKCRRFEVLFPNGAAPFLTYGVATFDGVSEEAEVVWNNADRFTDADYLTIVGIPIVSGGGSAAVVWEDETQRTATGTTILASAPFTGEVLAIAFLDGENPYANLSASDLGRLTAIIHNWKPARTTCEGVHVLIGGRYWDWPLTTFQDYEDAGALWGGSETVSFEVE